MSTNKREPLATEGGENEPISLATLLAEDPESKRFTYFRLWIVGDTPLITHAWSEKARREMLGRQVKALKAGKGDRDPHADFISSLYPMGKDQYGFPAMGIKNCLVNAAHKDKGIAKTATQAALWIDADLARVRTAMAEAICDVPLIRIYGSAPEMREDMVRIGSGIAALTYRGQFAIWAMKITGKINTSVLSLETLVFLIREAGTAYGLGEWRNERKGVFGAFHLAPSEEEKAWEKFASGKGKVPIPTPFKAAA